MNFIKITKDDMLNGPGIRAVLWVSGCRHACEGCHNKEATWNPTYGNTFTEEDKNGLMKYLSETYVDGITLSGGDPLHENNIEDINNLVRDIRNRFGSSKTIWLYTGYRLDEILEDSGNITRQNIIKNIDVLCDGKFDISLRDPNLDYVGSSNQRVIKIKDLDL